ncbi:MAG: hypothetical protein ACO1OB_33795, partial [Archangium sp.]
ACSLVAANFGISTDGIRKQIANYAEFRRRFLEYVEMLEAQVEREREVVVAWRETGAVDDNGFASLSSIVRRAVRRAFTSPATPAERLRLLSKLERGEPLSAGERQALLVMLE